MQPPIQLPLLFDEGPAPATATLATIYTMGYAGWAPAGLRDEVLRLGATLIDVRIAPTSKSPQWRKEALAELMGERYVHLPALGNRNAFNGGPAELAAPERAVEPVAALLTHGPVILLCGCARPERCHRGLAAAYLAERLGGVVKHIPAPERPPRDDDGQLGLPL
jgi:uncharacterized protein (DUF488 family)